MIVLKLWVLITVNEIMLDLTQKSNKEIWNTRKSKFRKASKSRQAYKTRTLHADNYKHKQTFVQYYACEKMYLFSKISSNTQQKLTTTPIKLRTAHDITLTLILCTALRKDNVGHGLSPSTKQTLHFLSSMHQHICIHQWVTGDMPLRCSSVETHQVV